MVINIFSLSLSLSLSWSPGQCWQVGCFWVLNVTEMVYRLHRDPIEGDYMTISGCHMLYSSISYWEKELQICFNHTMMYLLHVLLSNSTHADVIKWKHFARYCPFVWVIHRSPVNVPHKDQWRGALMFSHTPRVLYLLYPGMGNSFWVQPRNNSIFGVIMETGVGSSRGHGMSWYFGELKANLVTDNTFWCLSSTSNDEPDWIHVVITWSQCHGAKL